MPASAPRKATTAVDVWRFDRDGVLGTTAGRQQTADGRAIPVRPAVVTEPRERLCRGEEHRARRSQHDRAAG